MKSMKRGLWLVCAFAALFVLPFESWSEEAGIDTWGVNDATYGLKTREAEVGFSYTPSPADWRDINIYQLFTDRFADSGDQLGSYKPSWKSDGVSFPGNRNFHHGGDWKGLQNNLDYLSGMGVKAVWISGVQQNDQGKDTRYTPYHQYHPDNFFKADPAMGTFADLKNLIDACHARGIYVILDVVVNHTCDKNGLWGNSQEDDKQYWPSGNGTFGWWNDGSKHPAPFDNLNYFHNNGTINCWDCSPENLLGQFKGTDDLKTDDSAVQDIMLKAFKNLIDATDCDGFRVDAIKHVEYNWIRTWAQGVRDHAAARGKNDFILFGELFTYNTAALASYCADGYGFNSALFFPMSQTIKGVFGDGGWTGWLGQTMGQVSQFGVGANRLVTFIDNHDLNRISLQISGTDTGNAVWKLKPAMSFLYLATPVPCLYYGTEHVFNQGGHYNGSSPSADNPDDGDWQRECMFDKGFQPGPAQGNKLAATDAPLYQHIKALNAARAAYKSLTRGSFTERWQEGSAGAYAFSRVYDTEEALVALNTADGSKSINPLVGKPDGTEFVNALNPSEKVVVSGGRLSFSLAGKETKVFVAGIAAPEMWARGTHASPADGVATASDPVFINTEAGPTGVVASAKVGYSADGGTTWNLLAMTATNWTSEGGAWYSARLGQYPADTVIKYYVEIADTNANKKWDNNNGLNYTLTVKPAAGVWTRHAQNYPVDGAVTDTTELWVNIEAGPSGTVTGVRAFYSTNGTTWTNRPLAANSWGSDGGNWYEASLGTFAAGATVRYYVEATDGAMTNKDDNGGAYYSVTVRSLGDDLWAGNTVHAPANGFITATNPIGVTCESWPIGVATNVGMAYSADGGVTWAHAILAPAGTNGNNDLWSADLGTFADGTIVQYAVFAQSATKEVWDNNGGQDYRAIVGEVGGLRMVEHTPVISAGGSPDNASDDFDFATTGGAATTSGTNGFGSFGSVYVNYDETNLYIGGTAVALPDDSTNNAYIVLLSGGIHAGTPNFWAFDGLPNGIDFLHNAAFQPAVNLAILLGDVWGDGTFPSFSMYGGYDFGQGVFATPSGGTDFLPVGGARLSQFGGYGPDSRLAANWECAIPLTNFGVSSAAELTNLFLSGLMVTKDTHPTNSVNRFISGRYLGDSATLGNEELPDEWGNFAFSFVNLGGTKVLPPQSANADLGVPDSWVEANLGVGYPLTTNSNFDGDDYPDRDEYFAGLDPAVSNDFLHFMMLGGRTATVYKVGGQSCAYVIDIADSVTNGGWNWTPHSTVSSLDGRLVMPNMGLASVMMRVRVNVPPVDQPVDRVTVGATPAGGSFSAETIPVALIVSGVNVTSSTYTVQGGSATDYTNGQMIVFGAGMTNGQTRTLTLDGGTISGVGAQKIYTFTKTAASLPISWTGNVGTDPASGAWDEGESLTISFETAPSGAAASVGVVYSANGGVSWSTANLTQAGSNASNDLWTVAIGTHVAGTVVQFALEAKDGQGNSTWNNNNNNNYSISVNGGAQPGSFKPYSTNPTKGAYRSAGITIDGSNTGGEWTTNMLISLDVVNDDPRTLGDNWTTHEAPIDFSHLWACWDDENVYLAWQMMDVTDVIDPANAGGGDPINRNDGILIWAVLDTQTGGCTTDMWSKSNTWAGANTPDFQIYMAGSLWQSYMSREAGGVFPVDDGGINYKTCAAWGMRLAKSAALIAPDAWGVRDCDNRLNDSSTFENFKVSGHARTERDSFYEIQIPLTALGVTKTQLESTGIAVMMGAGSLSAMDTIPNSSGNTDTPGTESYNSSFEWGDSDTYTEPFARIGN